MMMGNLARISNGSPPVTLADRQHAWPLRPSCYHDNQLTRDLWNNGIYDNAAPCIRAFTRARIDAQANVLAAMQGAEETMVKALETVMNVSTPSMGTDNLAVTICCHFDNPEQEADDDNCGWTPDAQSAYEELQAAIQAHFAPALASLRSAIAQMGGA